MWILGSRRAGGPLPLTPFLGAAPGAVTAVFLGVGGAVVFFPGEGASVGMDQSLPRAVWTGASSSPRGPLLAPREGGDTQGFPGRTTFVPRCKKRRNLYFSPSRRESL